MKLGRRMRELHLKWELRILCLTVHMSKSINSAEKKMTYKPVNQLTDPPVSEQLWVMIDWPVKLFSSSWPTCTHNSQTKPLQGLSNWGWRGGEHCCLKARRSGFWICMFSSLLHGLSPGTLGSSHCPKTCKKVDTFSYLESCLMTAGIRSIQTWIR